MLQGTWACRNFFDIVIWFLLDRYTEVVLLDHMLVSAFWGTSILLSTVAVPVYLPPNNLWGLSFLHTPPKLLPLIFLKIAILKVNSTIFTSISVIWIFLYEKILFDCYYLLFYLLEVSFLFIESKLLLLWNLKYN